MSTSRNQSASALQMEEHRAGICWWEEMSLAGQKYSSAKCFATRSLLLSAFLSVLRPQIQAYCGFQTDYA